MNRFKTIATLLLITSVCVNCGVTRFKKSETTMDKNSPYSQGKAIGTIQSPKLNEISGIAPSTRYTDHMWVLNDSGDEPNVYLINLKGELIVTLNIPSISNRDWESITLADGYIYIGETGDNKAAYPDKKIYRIEEPTTIDVAKKDAKATCTAAETMLFNFANGQRDCETMMFDPISNEIVLVSKREEKVMLYSMPFVATAQGQTVEVEPLATLTFDSAVAGDISLDGSKILIKNYMDIYFYTRHDGETVAEAVSREPIRLAYTPEPQGEAIAWSTHEDKFYTISEQAYYNPQPVEIFEYSRVK